MFCCDMFGMSKNLHQCMISSSAMHAHKQTRMDGKMKIFEATFSQEENSTTMTENQNEKPVKRVSAGSRRVILVHKAVYNREQDIL